MAPAPQEPCVKNNVNKKMRPPPGEEVVISGMSGIFPKSDSIQEFMENLYNKVDMVTTENPRWEFNHSEVPKHLGKVNGMEKFDAQFFRVHYKQATTMEPMSRKLLEHAYSAIYDSGINPLQLRGKKVGVFIGSAFSESEKVVIYENIQCDGLGLTGCNKSMYANRISYWIDGKGPSFCLDVACASSIACVEYAYRSIISGQCDAAIVGGCNLCMHPKVSLNFRRAGFLSLDGKTRCFDKNSEGYVRSDAISVLFMQKAKDAKRIYSEVFHAKTSISVSDSQFLSIRQPKELQEFLEGFYSEIDVCPEDVEYIEANGAANVEADKNELIAIGSVFAKNKPVKIGCVKSNMGSSEPASGLCGLTKACLAYHTGKIPGNLHYNDPLEIPEVKNGKIQILTDNVEFSRGYTALNCFAYTGANVHVLLKSYYKEKDLTRYKSSIPYLVPVSGRQEDCVESMLKKLKENPVDPEQIGLIHNIHKYDIPGHMYRGYSILDTNDHNETVCLTQKVQYCPENAHPIWFVYSGMGSQWAGMGAELLRIPIFAAAIQKCHKALEPKGIDIVRILTDPDKTIFDNILHSFVGIAAVQIGLTDILQELGIVPDNIIGHSVGELGCAYADGCFTAEEMILSAYSRGLVSVKTPFIKGSMAAIGLGYESILPMCPPEIEVACHNSDESSTISGPSDVMKKFVTELTSQGIFAKEVPCGNIAFHSRYIADGGPELLKYLKEVIKEPKARSEKWISTSVPEEKWNDPIAKYSSAEYHTNNLLNSVLFAETSKLIPNNALVIEIAPHGLLQAILKRSLSECVHIPLTRRGAADPVRFLLEAIGMFCSLDHLTGMLKMLLRKPITTRTSAWTLVELIIGERVMGLIPEGALSSTVEADLDLLWPVPDHWSLEDAATVPLPYVLAYYCLAIRTQMTKNKKVFITGGAGALGQAVLSICLSLNCIVYTTVSDLMKKEFLLRLFPQLNANNIGLSSDPYFQDVVRSSTNGLRCELVINCASGPLRRRAMDCAGYNSEMLDLNEYDMKSNEEFGMNFLKQANHYISVQLKNLFKPEYAEKKKDIQKFISAGIANGIVKPLSRIVYAPENVSRAFSLLSLSKHRGRVLIEMKNAETRSKDLNVLSKIRYSSKGTYIVVCDEPVIGMELADRLVKNGARKLIINIKPNLIDSYCYTKFVSWNKSNTIAKISTENLQNEKSCVNLLKESAKLGPILGIFIVQNLNKDDSFDSENISDKFNNTAGVVANLDLTSRNICNELEHFVVSNRTNGEATNEYIMSVIDRICQTRNDIGLPALVQRVGLLKEIEEGSSTDSKIQPQSIYTVLNALETSLKFKYNNIMSYNLKKDKTSYFLDKIAGIIGLTNINEIDEHLNLKNFFANENVNDELNEAIKEAYGVSYSVEKLQNMTVASLKTLQKELLKSRSEYDKGLGAFFKHFEKDECMAAEPMLSMATCLSNIKEEEEMDSQTTYLILLPGFESHHEIFTTVCERLKVQAMAFQYGPELTNADVPEIAAYIRKFMKSRIDLKSKFYLLGYSFGVNVALELASLFEKEGHVGVVYCLDSSPDVLGTQFDAYVGKLSDCQLQNSLIQHLYRLMLGEENEDLIQELENKDSWNDKVEICVNKLRGKVNCSHQYKRCIIQGAYRRIMLAREYRPKFKLQSELVLIKGVPHPRADKLPEDYGLSKYTYKPIQVFDISSEHAAATKDCIVANIINRLLEPKLLEEFKNKNLCWSYTADPIKGW